MTLLLFACQPPMPVDITGNVQRMWLGCVMGANPWLQSPLDVVQREYIFCCFGALFY